MTDINMNGGDVTGDTSVAPKGTVVTINGTGYISEVKSPLLDNSDVDTVADDVEMNGGDHANYNKYISIIDVNGSGANEENDVSIVAIASNCDVVQCEVSNGDADMPSGEDVSGSRKNSEAGGKPIREKLKRTRSGSCGDFYWNYQQQLSHESNDSTTQDDPDACIVVDFLDKSVDCAEARLAAKRLARAEAREIRMKELEKQQREAEENSDKIYDIYNTSDAVNRPTRVAAQSVASPRSSSVLSGGNNSYHSSRRSSEDSLEEVASLRDVRQELKEVEEKFRKAMIANAQLDNEKAAAAYQLELYKDRLEELDERYSQLQREHREKCRQFEALKRATVKLQEDLEFTKAQLEERDRLIEEEGLVIVGGEYSTSEEENSDNEQNTKHSTINSNNNNNNISSSSNNNVSNSLVNSNSKTKPPNNKRPPKRALVSAQVAGALQQVGGGSLDKQIKKFVEHRNELLDNLSRLKLELEEERARNRGQRNSTMNGPSDDYEEEIQREANKLLGDYKFKLQKAEQDVSTLQANVARLESQVVRYKSAAETAEKVEDELKVEKRKLQRELRDSQGRVEELETSHSHLQRRLDKLKNAKSALLKDL